MKIIIIMRNLVPYRLIFITMSNILVGWAPLEPYVTTADPTPKSVSSNSEDISEIP